MHAFMSCYSYPAILVFHTVQTWPQKVGILVFTRPWLWYSWVVEALCCISVDVDAVAGWLGSYGGEDSTSDISRGR